MGVKDKTQSHTPILWNFYETNPVITATVVSVSGVSFDRTNYILVGTLGLRFEGPNRKLSGDLPFNISVYFQSLAFNCY